MLGRRSRENLPRTDRSWSLLTEVVDRPTLLSTFTTYYSYLDVYIPHLSVTEAARGADERKSLKKLKLKHRPKLGQKMDYYFLLENLFDMVNRRDSVFSC